MKDGSLWPLISIVTPSFNQADYIEQTIRSVLLQGYPYLEYFVLDGGSRDGTKAILEKYSPWLSGWRSYPDGGQVAAINQGLERCTGQIIAYINSDDYYLPGAFESAANALYQGEAGLFCGPCRHVDTNGNTLEIVNFSGNDLVDFLDLRFYESNYLTQPEVFWTRQVWEQCGSFDPTLEIVFDYEYWVRAIARGYRIQHSTQDVACFRRHTGQKIDNRSKGYFESVDVARRYFHQYFQKIPTNQHNRINKGIRFAARLGWKASCWQKLELGDIRGLLHSMPGCLSGKIPSV
jgi:glycosyltransferase involved in cell wall biosynthesis